MDYNRLCFISMQSLVVGGKRFSSLIAHFDWQGKHLCRCQVVPHEIRNQNDTPAAVFQIWGNTQMIQTW